MKMKHRGISTFIATLLLMVLAVSAGVVIYAYTMGYLGGFGGTEQLGAMSVDTYSGYDNTPDNITAYVRNIGKTSINITTAYVDGVAAAYIGNDDNSSVADIIEEGDVAAIVITPSQNLEVGKTYDIKLIAQDNTQLSFSCKIK